MHSGADLDAAVRSVMGYDAVSMKGKKIKVEPVAGVATPELGELLEAALEARATAVRADQSAWIRRVVSKRHHDFIRQPAW